jgi:hypothetical protein
MEVNEAAMRLHLLVVIYQEYADEKGRKGPDKIDQGSRDLAEPTPTTVRISHKFLAEYFNKKTIFTHFLEEYCMYKVYFPIQKQNEIIK